ncbi:hypothetical protein AgCh_005432 [Apium graveolens]
MLRKYHRDASHIVEYEHVDMQPDLTYVEQPVKIMDKKEQVLRNKVIKLVRVLWQNHNVEESTWEARKVPPFVFNLIPGQNPFKERRLPGYGLSKCKWLGGSPSTCKRPGGGLAQGPNAAKQDTRFIPMFLLSKILGNDNSAYTSIAEEYRQDEHDQLPIRKRIGNVLQFPVGIDAAVAEGLKTTERREEARDRLGELWIGRILYNRVGSKCNIQAHNRMRTGPNNPPQASPKKLAIWYTVVVDLHL